MFGRGFVFLQSIASKSDRQRTDLLLDRTIAVGSPA